MNVKSFELKLITGEIVVWDGKDGEDATKRYADAHPGSIVVAWRHPRVDLVVGIPAIVE